MLQLAAIVLVGISAALSGFIITDSIAPQRTPAETAVAAVASVDLPEPTTVTNLPVFDPVEFEAVPGAGFPTTAPVQQPVAVIPSPAADTSLVQALAATVTTLAAQFGALEKLEGRLSGLEARPVSSLSPAVSGGGAAAPVYVNTHGLTQKIDRLENTTITNATISGGSITAASILGTIANVIDSAVASIDSLTADTLVATNAAFTNSTTTNATTTNHYISNLMAAAANVTGDLTVSGTITGGTLSVSGLSSGGAVEAPYFTATSTTATSSFAGGFTAGTNGLTVLQDGNVGVGTTSPITTLHVTSTSDEVARFERTAGNPFITLYSDSSRRGYLYSDPSSNLLLVNDTNAAMIFATNSTEQLRITSTGNVGIGTTNPGSPLSVVSRGDVSNVALDVKGVVVRANDHATSGGVIELNKQTGANTYGSLQVGDNLNWQPLALNPFGGNVGIGTTAPIGALNVLRAGSIYNGDVGIIQVSENAYQRLILGYDANLGTYGKGYIQSLQSNAGYTELLLNPNGGNVGIGTTAPTYTLDVNGAVRFGTSAFGADFGSGALRFTGSGPRSIYTSGYSSQFQIDGSSIALNANSGGNVGIGTTAPGELLDVRGNSGANKGVLVKNDGAGRAILRLDSGGTSTTNMFFALGGVDKWSLQANDSYNFAIIDNTVAAHRFLVDASGNVGIGTTTPSHTLSVAGTVGFDGLAGATGAGSLCLDTNKQVVYNAGSDACLPSLRDTKHDILALSLSGIDTIKQLEPVSFVYNEGDGRERLGFIAENTAAVQSELATYNAAGAISGIDDRAVLSVVVKAIKEMWAHVTGQDQRIAAHDTEIAALNVRIANLEVQLGAASAAVPTASTATIELLINGNNPALIAAGESYVDLGATASSSDTTLLALGIRTFVDGTAVETVVVDTSIAATTTITYRIIDGDGAVLAEAERTVVVSDPAQSELPAEQTTDEPIEPMSNN